MNKNVNSDLCLIKEKIIKTDEVIKLLLKRREENRKLHGKYQNLVHTYRKKCKDSIIIQDKAILLEEKLKNYDAVTKKCLDLEVAQVELQKAHDKYINELQYKYQKTAKEVEDLKKQLKTKTLSKDECGKSCFIKIAKLEKENAKLKNTKDIQSELIKFLEKENNSLKDKTTPGKENLIDDNCLEQAKNYTALTSFISQTFQDESLVSVDSICHFLNNHIQENKFFKEKIAQTSKKLDVLVKENSDLQNKCQTIKILFEKLNVQKKTLNVTVQTDIETVPEPVKSSEDDKNVIDDDFLAIVNDEEREYNFSYEIINELSEVEDSSDDESVGHIFRDYVLPKALSPFSNESENEEICDVFMDMFSSNPIETNIPTITVTPPTPPVQHSKNIFDLEETNEVLGTVLHDCENCKNKKKKIKLLWSKIRSDKSRVLKQHKLNNQLKNIIKKYKKIRKTKSIKNTKSKVSDERCSSPDFLGFERVDIIKPAVNNVVNRTTNNQSHVRNFIFSEQYCSIKSCRSYRFCFDNSRPTSPDFIGFEKIKNTPEFNKGNTQKGNTVLNNRVTECPQTCYIDIENKKDGVTECPQTSNNAIENKIDGLTECFRNCYNDKENNTDLINENSPPKIEIAKKDQLIQETPKVVEIKPKETYSVIFKVFEKMVEYIDKKIDLCSNSSFENKNKVISPEEEINFQQLLKNKRTRISERRFSSSSESVPSISIRRPKKFRRVQLREDDSDLNEQIHTEISNENNQMDETEKLFETEPVVVDSGYTSESKTDTSSINLNNTRKYFEEEKDTKKNVIIEKKPKRLSKLEQLRNKLKNARDKRTNISECKSYKRNEISSEKAHTQGIPQQNCEVVVGEKRKNMSDRNIIDEEPIVKAGCSKTNERILRSDSEKYKKVVSVKIAEDKVVKKNEKELVEVKDSADIIAKRKEAAIILELSKKEKTEKVEKVQYKRPIRRKIVECPRSPSPVVEKKSDVELKTKPKIIPLEKPAKLSKQFALSLLEKLINFPNEAKILEEIVDIFSTQEKEFIAELIIDKASLDIYDEPDTKFSPPAPLMTSTQRTLLGLMVALNNKNSEFIDTFLTKVEPKLLLEKKLLQISPVLRLYLAVCKMRHDRERMRRMSCDAVYFMGDLAVPFMFIVATSWSDVIPMNSESKDMPLLRALIKVIMLKNCDKPGYNFNNLKMVIMEYYGYKELETNDEMFKNLFDKYIESPSWTLQYAILLLCKYCTKHWVITKIEKVIVPCINSIEHDKLLMAIFSLVKKIGQLFTEDCDAEYSAKIKLLISSLQKGVPNNS